MNEVFYIPFIRNLKTAIKKYPEIDFSDALSIGQMRSKQWLITILNDTPNLGTIFILGGWYGILPALMAENSSFIISMDKIRSFDIDPSCAEIADTMNRDRVTDDWKFKASTMDMYEMDYNETQHTTYRANGSSIVLTDTPDTIINTSCEHLDRYSEWYDILPKDKLLVLQSNNFFEGDGHVNCVTSLEEFKQMSPMTKYFYEGELYIPEADYTRYMLIGQK